MSDALLRKADLVLNDLSSNGGLLSEDQTNTFIRSLIDQPTILNECRIVQMSTPVMNVNKIKFGSRILQRATQGSAGSDENANDRYLAAALRSAPTTSQVQLVTKEVIAEVRLPYEVLEDNIETSQLANTVLALVAERAALDMEEIIISGDTALSSTLLLSITDGILKRATAHTVNAASEQMSAAILNNTKKALPTAYRRNLAALRYYVTMDAESDYRLALSARGTSLGDAIIQGNQPLNVFGSAMRGVAMMPDGYAVYTDPKNIIVGMQRNVTVETDKDIRSREMIIVLTARMDVNIEETDAIVKVTNLAD